MIFFSVRFRLGPYLLGPFTRSPRHWQNLAMMAAYSSMFYFILLFLDFLDFEILSQLFRPSNKLNFDPVHSEEKSITRNVSEFKPEYNGLRKTLLLINTFLTLISYTLMCSKLNILCGVQGENPSLLHVQAFIVSGNNDDPQTCVHGTIGN